MPDRSRIPLFEVITREVRHSARLLLRTPAFSLIAFVTLAIGIGATTAIYTVLDAVALRPLAYRNADRLVSILHPATVPGNGESKWGLSSAGYFYFKAHNHSFEDFGGYTTSSAIVVGDQSSEEVREADVTASIFSTLDVRAAVGRLIGPSDDVPHGPAVVVLGYDYWQRRFGGDRNVVGTILQTSSGPLQIIGVTEQGLSLPKPGPFASTSDLASFGVDLWRPIQLDPAGPFYNSHQYSGIGRLRSGVTPAAAQRDLANLMRDFPTQYPQVYSTAFMQKFNFRVGVVPLRDEMLGPKLANALWVLFGAVAVVLFIACANVANLFIVRMESRRRESAIRTALGADRLHMALHFLSESLLLTLSAAVAGVVIARVGLGAILAIAPTDIPRLATVSLNGWSIVLAFALAIIAGVVFGLIPLARTTVDVNTLREGARGMTASTGQRAVRSALVVGQVALALVLLATAGLMLRSFANLRNVKPGLDPSGVLTFETILPSTEFKNGPSVTAFLRQFQQRVAALPGVTRVGASTSLPLQDFGSGCTAVGREGLVFGPNDKPPCVATPQALPGFFESLGIQVRGRTPVWSDVDPNAQASTVAVVTQALANDLWPGQDVIGKGISIGGTRGLHQYYRIIGVVPELRAQGLDQPATEVVFTAEVNRDPVWTVKTTRGNPAEILPSIRQMLGELNPRVPIVNPRTMSDVVARSTARASFVMTLLVIAGVMALLLSAVGIYGVISYLVTQRRSEIGVRMALGARMPQVAALVLGESMRLAVAGVIIGLIAALLAMRLVRSLLFEVSPADPLVLAATSVTLLVIAAVASLAPTRRAAKIDPVEAMRSS
ncbi:MAG TPA: ABC transporter permease [Gemmatimonadaceae bacterium]|jgi:predicted permease